MLLASTVLEPRSNPDGWLEKGKPADISFLGDDVRAQREEFVSRDVDIDCLPPEQLYGTIGMDVVGMCCGLMRL